MAFVLTSFCFYCVKVVDTKEIEVAVVEAEVQGAAAAAAVVEGLAEMATGVVLIQGTFFSRIGF